MLCHPSNTCAGVNGTSLDILVTDMCNAKCPFCFNRETPCTNTFIKIDVAKTIIRQTQAENVLLLGGEPTLYPMIEELINYSKTHGKKVYMTTNGTRMDGFAYRNLDGLNISIHHYDPAKIKELMGIRLDMNHIASSVKMLKSHNPSLNVRINCNLVRGYIDDLMACGQMLHLAETLGCDHIRFNELQDTPDLYVNAQSIFSELQGIDPFIDGCEQSVFKFNRRVTSSVHMTCGLLNPERPKPDEIEGRKASTIIHDCNGKQITYKRILPKTESVNRNDISSMTCHETVSSSNMNCHSSSHHSSGCH